MNIKYKNYKHDIKINITGIRKCDCPFKLSFKNNI